MKPKQKKIFLNLLGKKLEILKTAKICQISKIFDWQTDFMKIIVLEAIEAIQMKRKNKISIFSEKLRVISPLGSKRIKNLWSMDVEMPIFNKLELI